ncbi:hypothetical protein MAR_014052 [Mya arenaria]|uniref:Uncharacterized protein n=1 Tax=Mya arenaria TaxID=6604 RepID=A0ABY7G1M3_MYAAR|nr:hypothetical protein MAR_014052 [Mya arenaria]
MSQSRPPPPLQSDISPPAHDRTNRSQTCTTPDANMGPSEEDLPSNMEPQTVNPDSVPKWLPQPRNLRSIDKIKTRATGSEKKTPAVPVPISGATVVSPTTITGPFPSTVTSDTTQAGSSLPPPNLRK